MEFWLSRIITVLLLAILVSLNAARVNRRQLAWLDTTSSAKVVDFERRPNSHGFAYHFVFGTFGGVEMLVVLEVVSWGLRRMSQPRNPTVGVALDQTAVRPPE
jgi:hypothetical protein